MSILLVIAIAIVLLILVWVLVVSAPFGDARLKWVLKALAVIAAILFIAHRAGWA